MKKTLKIKAFNQRNIMILMLVFLLFLMFKKYVVGVLLAAAFAPITFYSLRYSKFIPHVSVETNTASSIFMAYLFGPWVGFFYALGVGGFCYVKNSLLNITFISTLLFASLCALVAGMMANMGFSFFWCWITPLAIRAVVGYPYFMLFVAPFESLTHQTTHFFLNGLIYYQLYSALLGLLTLIGAV